MAGRTFNDLMQYPVVPFTVADYKSEKLNLDSSRTFRYSWYTDVLDGLINRVRACSDFSKPISVQDETKVEKYLMNYKVSW